MALAILIFRSRYESSFSCSHAGREKRLVNNSRNASAFEPSAPHSTTRSRFNPEGVNTRLANDWNNL